MSTQTNQTIAKEDFLISQTVVTNQEEVCSFVTDTKDESVPQDNKESATKPDEAFRTLDSAEVHQSEATVGLLPYIL